MKDLVPFVALTVITYRVDSRRCRERRHLRTSRRKVAGGPAAIGPARRDHWSAAHRVFAYDAYVAILREETEPIG
jgi:hypothetical protein